MNKENKLIPELRFPEFVNEREWVDSSIDSIGEVVTGGTPSKKEKKFWGGDFVWVTAQDFKGKYISDSFLKLTQKGKEKSRVIPTNSVLVTCIASIGLNGINNVECATNQQINSIICNSDNNFEFVYYAISKNSNRLKNLAGQTAVPIVNKSVFEKFKIHKPAFPQEQQKIASCLSSLDDLISAHSDKLETLKNHKKGLMQNLFPQEGKKVPNYRFPEFENDGEWEEKKLKDVAIFSKGKGISKSDVIENGKTPCIRYGELYTHYDETISVVHSYINLNPKNLVVSEANDVIMPASGETQVDIATASCVLEDGIALGSDLNIIKTKINGVFLSYYLNNTKKMDIARMAQGISVVHLYANQLKTLVLNIPKPKEQKKIASCLSSLDKLITEQTEKIEELKQHKKGLMQGLFPAIER